MQLTITYKNLLKVIFIILLEVYEKLSSCDPRVRAVTLEITDCEG